MSLYHLGYGRISKEDKTLDIHNAALNQEKRLLRWGCNEVLFDIQSGKDDDRPNFQLLLKRIENRDRCDVLVITKIDRISRSLATILTILQLLTESKVQLVVLELGDSVIDTSNPYIWKQLASEGINSDFYLRQLSSNIQAGYRELRRDGKANPIVPIGYKRVDEKYALDPETSEMVRDIFEKYLEIRHNGKVCAYAKQKYNWNMQKSTLHSMLKNPTYRGHTIYKTSNKEKINTIIPNTHPPLLSEAEYLQIKAIMERNAQIWGGRGKKKDEKTIYSLSFGIFRCSVCGAKLYISIPGNKRRYLRCNNSKLTKSDPCSFKYYIPYELCEDAIIQAICSRSSELSTHLSKDDTKFQEESPEIAKIRAKIITLQTMGDDETIKKAISEYQSQLEQLYKLSFEGNLESEQLRKMLQSISSDAEFWKTIPPEELNMVFKLYVKHASVRTNKEGYVRPSKHNPVEFIFDIELKI